MISCQLKFHGCLEFVLLESMLALFQVVKAHRPYIVNTHGEMFTSSTSHSEPFFTESPTIMIMIMIINIIIIIIIILKDMQYLEKGAILLLNDSNVDNAYV